jgi:hypothetical protein
MEIPPPCSIKGFITVTTSFPKSLFTFLFSRGGIPRFEKEGIGEI